MTKPTTLLMAVLLLGSCGCLNKIPAVAHYQQRATAKCEEKHSAEQCKPLNYPSCDPVDRSCRQ